MNRWHWSWRTIAIFVLASSTTICDEGRGLTEAGNEMHLVFGRENAEFFASRRSLRSPNNQWKPHLAPIPVNIATFVQRATTHILDKQKDKVSPV